MRSSRRPGRARPACSTSTSSTPSAPAGPAAVTPSGGVVDQAGRRGVQRQRGARGRVRGRRHRAPWDVDALLRQPGRLDHRLLVLPPDRQAREAIICAVLDGRPLADDLDVAALAARTDKGTRRPTWPSSASRRPRPRWRPRSSATARARSPWPTSPSARTRSARAPRPGSSWPATTPASPPSPGPTTTWSPTSAPTGRRSPKEAAMRYVNLGSTGLRVSGLCLGMMSFGRHESREWALDETAAEPIVRRAVEGGVSFFDTANVYNGGQSEIVTGRLPASSSACARSTWWRPRCTAGPCPARTAAPQARPGLDRRLARAPRARPCRSLPDPPLGPPGRRSRRRWRSSTTW